MSGLLARALYSLTLRLATPAYLCRLWWRGRSEPAYRSRWSQRLGWYVGSVKRVDVWIHAVSLGETLASRALIDELRQRLPMMRLLLTHSTATGLAAGQKLLGKNDVQAWLPFDTPGAVKRFLRHFKPRVGVLMETEVWPNLLHHAKKQQVPMVLANARLSERSLAKAEKLRALMAPAVASLARVLAQSPADALRLRQAGALQPRVCGNLKFDLTPPARLVARGHEWRQALGRPVVLAAVTREGEEAPLLKVWASSPQPRPLLLLVPRHPQRFDQVATLALGEGFKLRRRSEWGDTPSSDALSADVWLGDSMGEMAMYYATADVALLGGSFEPLGGQNLIEAAACGCPLIMGPHTFNFTQAAQWSLEAEASFRVKTIQEGVHVAVKLASDPMRNRWVEQALLFAASHRGAAERMAIDILTLLDR